MKKLNVLFVCKWNRFRSRLAENYFNKINKNKNIKAKSAGIIQGHPLDPDQIDLAKRFGIDINGKTKGLNSELLDWQEVIVLVAGDVPKEIFTKNNTYTKKLIVWKFPDFLKTEKQIINKVIIPLKKKVEELNRSIEKGELK